MPSAGHDEGTAARALRERELAAALGPLGVWDCGLCFAPAASARAAAAALEEAGYGAAWLHEAGRDAFAGAALLLAATTRLAVGTSIVSIWRHEPGQMTNAARTLGEAWPGRFVLGIGNSHHGATSWHGRSYARAVTDIAEYLDAMEREHWHLARPDPPVPRVLAALGPRMLDLARRRARGAIPYLVPVSHTAHARERLGPDPVLAVQQAIVLGEGEALARERARAFVGPYLGLPNYRRNLLRCGFAEADLGGGGSDRLLAALVAWGGADEAAARVREHLAAGADHVCVSVLSGRADTVEVEGLRALGALAGARP